MRFEIILLLITGFIMANIYTDGKYIKMAMTWKKYYQMAGVAFGAFVLYWLMKKNPMRAQQMLATSNEYVKYLPIDRGTSDIISPILDFTSKHSFGNDSNTSFNYPVVPMSDTSRGEQRLMTSGQTSGQPYGQTSGQPSGKKATKRSVSETKKKFVASRQNWRCGDCGDQLTAWFEVDHKIRLEHSGSNHIDNLVALCRDCHGKKTTMENL